MKNGMLLALTLVALALWIFGLVSSQALFAFLQIVLAAATLTFLIHFVRRRRAKRDFTRRARHAP